MKTYLKIFAVILCTLSQVSTKTRDYDLKDLKEVSLVGNKYQSEGLKEDRIELSFTDNRSLIFSLEDIELLFSVNSSFYHDLDRVFINRGSQVRLYSLILELKDIISEKTLLQEIKRVNPSLAQDIQRVKEVKRSALQCHEIEKNGWIFRLVAVGAILGAFLLRQVSG